MKRFSFIFAALLLSVGTFAQSGNNGTPLKGDINEDGVVNLADVTALVNLILNGGGGTAQTTTYYWYVGQTNPSNNSTIVTENGVPGWRLTGNSLASTYNYDSAVNPIASSPVQLSEWYFALPENSGLGVFDAQNTNYAVGTPVSTYTFNNVNYNVWKTGKTVKFNAYYIKNK